MDEERFNTSVRKFLRQVGVTSQQEIEKLVQSGAVTGPVLKVRMTLTAENAALAHVVEADIDLGEGAQG
jgi:16S rRNA U516 pseudouridylate synthase RsuA-like enzyme